MVITRSQSGVEETPARHHQVFEQPPRSPSTTVVPPRRGEPLEPPRVGRLIERHTAAATSEELLTSVEPPRYSTATGMATTDTSAMPSYTPGISRVRMARSTRSSASAIAKLRYEAEERLATIRRKELEIEAELIRKKLEADVTAIEDGDSANEDVNEPSEQRERVHAWLDNSMPKEDALRGEPERISTAVDAPAPEPVPVYDDAIRTHTVAEAVTPDARRSRHWATTPEERRRSPTPRERRVEKLSEAIEKALRTRPTPAPRQVTDLPIFTGSPMDWLQFSAAMRETTRLYEFTPLENLARLRNCLRGEARDVVTPLLSTATHPDEVMRTLEQCFGRPEILVDMAFEDLKKLPRLGPTAMELNAFAVKVQNVVAALRNVNAGYLYNPMLVREILDKLNPHLKTTWCDYAEEHYGSGPEICKLSQFLMRQADRALKHSYSTLAQSTVAPRREASRPALRSEVKGKKIYTVTEQPSVKAATTEAAEPCPSCQRSHNLPDCQKFKQMQLDERWEVVKNAGLCFKCISWRHRRFNCRQKSCGVRGCNRPHHALLHSEAKEEGYKENATVATAATCGEVKLKVCPVVVTGEKGSRETFALFDEGATVTIIDEDLAKEIGAEGPTSRLHVKGIKDKPRTFKSREVNINVKAKYGKSNGYDIDVRTMEDLDLTTQTIPAEVMELAHLRDLRMEEITYTNAKPRILIGTDNWPLIVTRELRTGKPNEPAASRTELGWVIHGTVPRKGLRRVNEVLHVTTVKNDPLEEMIREHFKVDALGVSLNLQHVRETDKRAMEIFERTARRQEGHFEVGLPWREDNVQLPLSYNTALRRLKNLERKLERDPTEKKQYSDQIRDLMSKGYAKKCDGTEDSCAMAWYLPHFAVHNPNKPKKLRVVFDAAAKTNGVCLNDYLLEGPDLLQSLQRIMFRFREGAYAVTADIKEMFLRIRIREEDQPAQMFLWREHPTEPVKKFKMVSMIFGASSSPFLAHSVRNKNAHDHATTHPEALAAITEAHYMDDLVESFHDINKASATISQVDEVHQAAGFHLRQWNSNCTELMKNIKPEERAGAMTTPIGEGEKMLGLLWDSNADSLHFNTSLHRVPNAVKNRERPPTKREALSTVMSIYDPLGLLSCYTITAKIALQQLWKLETGWDEAVPEEIASKFDKWLCGMSTIGCLSIPRSYHGGREVNRRELHIFVDASEDAYAAVAYWRLMDNNKKIDTVLIAARARVAPLKTLTIPRLELQAALIGVRLAQTIKEDHRIPIHEVRYWSDSQTVLHWIRNGSRRYTPFVTHRLGEIVEASTPAEWRWVPTAINIADVATRPGYLPTNIEDRWFTGPEFLRGPRSKWPHEEEKEDDTTELVCVLNTSNTSLPDVNRFSSYDRLIRATAIVLLFIQRCKEKSKTVEMNTEHTRRATNLWFQQVQSEHFGRELHNLRTEGKLSRDSPLRRLDVMIDDGLLKLRGRIKKADVPEEGKNPIILDGRHRFVKLLIEREHRRAGHANNERVVNDLRQRFWILRLRPTVKAIARSCLTCRIRNTKPQATPMGDLPHERLEAFKRPFSNCGLDYFGPIVVTIGRRHEKRWGALFTCLTTRAVHIELVESLSTNSAIMALRRMAARRGWPSTIYSDNATNFKGADVELKKAYADWLPHLREWGLKYDTRWKYIAPGAPNQGGAWERLVRSIKSALTATLHEKSPKPEVLSTLLTEAEFSVNSRPLTHVSVDPDDPEALTPNHFLLGTSMGLPFMGPCTDSDKKTWKSAQALADQFWCRWLKEYLPNLIPRPGSPSKPNIQLGDLVIVADPTLPRNTWPRGVVTSVHPGPDGVVRNTEVKTKGGIFRRPASKLVVIGSTLSEPRDADDAPDPDPHFPGTSGRERAALRTTSLTDGEPAAAP